MKHFDVYESAFSNKIVLLENSQRDPGLIRPRVLASAQITSPSNGAESDSFGQWWFFLTFPAAWLCGLGIWNVIYRQEQQALWRQSPAGPLGSKLHLDVQELLARSLSSGKATLQKHRNKRPFGDKIFLLGASFCVRMSIWHRTLLAVWSY